MLFKVKIQTISSRGEEPNIFIRYYNTKTPGAALLQAKTDDDYPLSEKREGESVFVEVARMMYP